MLVHLSLPTFFPSLEKVTLKGTQLRSLQTVLSELSQLPKLKYLDISDNDWLHADWSIAEDKAIAEKVAIPVSCLIIVCVCSQHNICKMDLRLIHMFALQALKQLKIERCGSLGRSTRDLFSLFPKLEKVNDLPLYVVLALKQDDTRYVVSIG